MTGLVRLRLSGNLGDITTVLADLTGSPAFRIHVDERTYSNRDGGVRVYAELTVCDKEIRA